MVLSKDDVILKQLNKELKKYKIKLNFRYYDICPFKDHKLEVMNIVIKYSKELESYHNKIFILSSLSDEEFKNAIPYLIDIYFYFLNNIYGMPRDEIYLFYLYPPVSRELFYLYPSNISLCSVVIVAYASSRSASTSSFESSAKTASSFGCVLG